MLWRRVDQQWPTKLAWLLPRRAGPRTKGHSRYHGRPLRRCDRLRDALRSRRALRLARRRRRVSSACARRQGPRVPMPASCAGLSCPWCDISDRAAVQARKELGAKYKLLELGDAASQKALLEELEVEERLDALIEKCLKRLLLARGVKSIAPSADVANSTRPPRLLRGAG
jgi:hypothetical protein